MADDVIINAGSGGATIAADEIGGKHHQRVKVQHGADGSATDVSTASPLPVGDAGGSLTVDSADLASIKAAVEIIDNVVAGSEAQVDIVAALPAGTNNIGDVDVLTVPADPFGANADAAVAAGAAGSMQAKLRLATTLLDAIKTSVELSDNAIAGSEMQVDVVGALPAGSNNIGQVDPRGNVAHDGADSGNPVKIGGRARTALPAAVAQDDRVDAIYDKHGRQLIAYAPYDQRTSGKVTLTNTTASDVIAAPGASVSVVVTAILVVNGHATVGTKVEIRDGTTVKLQGYATALGGGFSHTLDGGLFIATANTAVTARCVTTGADVDVFVSGYKIPG